MRPTLVLGAIAAIAACGGGSGSPDAPPSADAPSPTPDAPNEADRVDVTARSELANGAPDPEAIVIFADPTGAVVQDGPVDAAGTAYAYLPDGGTVTVLQVGDAGGVREVHLTTFRGVEPGDHLLAGPERSPTFRDGVQTFMTAAFTPPGSGYAGLITGCGSGQPNGTPGQYSLEFWASCVTPTFDLLAVADVGTTREFVWQPDVPYEEGGALTVASMWAPMSTATVDLLNVPDNLTRVFARWSTSIGGRPLEMDQRSVELPAPGAHTLSLIYPGGAGDRSLLEANQVRGIDLVEGYTRSTAVTTGAETIDFAALPVPVVTDRPMQFADQVTWTPAGTGGDMRIVIWQAHWSSAHDVAWTVVEDPAAAPMTTLPSLPVAYAADDPTRGSVTMDGTAVFYIDYDNLDGYAAARPHGTSLAYPASVFVDADYDAHVTFARGFPP